MSVASCCHCPTEKTSFFANSKQDQYCRRRVDFSKGIEIAARFKALFVYGKEVASKQNLENLH
jgi:hypothetical protein